MSTKMCNICKIIKNLADFGKSRCKDCDRAYARRYRKSYYNKNKDYIIKTNNIRNKELYNNKWQNRRSKTKIKPIKVNNIDHLKKIKHCVRTRLGQIVKQKNLTKRSKFSDYIGCSMEHLKKYFESKFQIGMTWENQGKWHIDHIIPLSTAKTIEDVYHLSHYTNLQPLWALENLKKGNKIMGKITKSEILMGRDKTHAKEYTKEISDNIDKLLEPLNKIRELYGKPMIVSSGWRPPSINATVKGAATKSNHTIGLACDFSDPDGSLDAFCKELDAKGKLKEMGLWLESPDHTKGWCHLDIKNRGDRKSNIFNP